MTLIENNTDEIERAALIQRRKVQLWLLALLMVVSTCVSTSLLLLILWLVFRNFIH